MILSDIKRYLQERKQATLSDLAIHFDIEPEAMRGMLEHWIHKGKVSKSALGASCKKGCASCSCDTDMESYLWRA
jgi:putative ferrous iron transport protein C